MPPHGARGQGGPPSHGRFGRMFPFLPAAELTPTTLDALVVSMSERFGDVNHQIPAGYTYLGQFVDHDLTFDPLSDLSKLNDPRALVDFRSPRLDLDSVYGSGPDDQPFMYDPDAGGARLKLLIGRSAPAQDGSVVEDLPRNDLHRALIGDMRNDENLIVAQLHLLFLRFHNKVVDHIRNNPPTADGLFEDARRLVRWHYQWIVVHDFLTRIVGESVVASVLKPGVGWRTARQPFIPVEFSGAAYRFGHSMVRSSYRLNDKAAVEPSIFPAPNSAVDPKRHLGGFRQLLPELAIDWMFFFESTPGHVPQPSMLIDTSLAPPLFALPPDVARVPQLARLNLERGAALGLPSGRDVAEALGETPLSAEELQLDKLKPEARPAVLAAPPLWYYVLCEAEAAAARQDPKLGPVGAHIVAQVLVGLLDLDPTSYRSQWPPWEPAELKEPADGDFTMADLVRFVTAP